VGSFQEKQNQKQYNAHKAKKFKQRNGIYTLVRDKRSKKLGETRGSKIGIPVYWMQAWEVYWVSEEYRQVTCKD
jgi:hypothetical protein